MSGPGPLVPADERIHPVDPAVWSWNESWFFSFIDLDGGPAGFFRIGVLPNQGRAMLWCFVHVDGEGGGDGEWLAVEEPLVAHTDLDLTDGIAHDRWGTRFSWRPGPPLGGAAFGFEGEALVRTGARAGAHRHVSIELACTASGAAVRTGSGADADRSTFEVSRFEQPLEATGEVVVDGRRHPVRAGAHRDRSWGPREWRQAFTLGDLQAPGRQLYFVGRSFPGLGMGFVREGDGVRHLAVVDGQVDYDDAARTIGSAWLRLEGDGGPPIEVTMVPTGPSVSFAMAHTCEIPEHWPYWRTLVEARVPGWDGPCRGWFETSRYGTPA